MTDSLRDGIGRGPNLRLMKTRWGEMEAGIRVTPIVAPVAFPGE